MVEPEVPLIYTIGHSTHPIDRFIGLLTANDIGTVADVRSYPASRRWPQFNQAELERALGDAGIHYRWMKPLGGRRHSVVADSPHQAWTHPAFRSYADHTGTAEFRDGLQDLAEAALQSPLAFMCSEGLWWKCHRRIISDFMTVAGWRVVHILPDGKASDHRLSEFARVVEGEIIYDGGTTGQLLK
jgi:uncharacterized protein (DUF488 family)